MHSWRWQRRGRIPWAGSWRSQTILVPTGISPGKRLRRTPHRERMGLTWRKRLTSASPIAPSCKISACASKCESSLISSASPPVFPSIKRFAFIRQNFMISICQNSASCEERVFFYHSTISALCTTCPLETCEIYYLVFPMAAASCFINLFFGGITRCKAIGF